MLLMKGELFLYIIRSETGNTLTKEGKEITFENLEDAKKQKYDLQNFDFDNWIIIKVARN